MLSSAAASLDSLFEHPEGVLSCCATWLNHRSSAVPDWFLRTLPVPAIFFSAALLSTRGNRLRSARVDRPARLGELQQWGPDPNL